MDSYDCNNLKNQFKTLSDAELASLIIEFVESDDVALALGEETIRRLTSLRVRDSFEVRAPREALVLS
jgi:hypothetical protein